MTVSVLKWMEFKATGGSLVSEMYFSENTAPIGHQNEKEPYS